MSAKTPISHPSQPPDPQATSIAIGGRPHFASVATLLLEKWVQIRANRRYSVVRNLKSASFRGPYSLLKKLRPQNPSSDNCRLESPSTTSDQRSARPPNIVDLPEFDPDISTSGGWYGLSVPDNYATKPRLRLYCSGLIPLSDRFTLFSLCQRM